MSRLIISVPSLYERPSDIPALLTHALTVHGAHDFHLHARGHGCPAVVSLALERARTGRVRGALSRVAVIGTRDRDRHGLAPPAHAAERTRGRRPPRSRRSAREVRARRVSPQQAARLSDPRYQLSHAAVQSCESGGPPNTRGVTIGLKFLPIGPAGLHFLQCPWSAIGSRSSEIPRQT